jgi:hypothetical protein
MSGSSISIVDLNGEYCVRASRDIKRNEVIIECSNEYTYLNRPGGHIIDDPGLDLVYKMLHDEEDELFPRKHNKFVLDNTYVKIMDRSIRDMLKDKKQQKFFQYFSSVERTKLIRYYAKFIYNAFALGDKGAAINVIAARFNHSCEPNVQFTPIYKDGCFVIVFKALKDIKKGEELFNSYLQDRDMRYIDRMEYLKIHYGFMCSCVKCIKKH